jgi:hypothetical protein
MSDLKRGSLWYEDMPLDTQILYLDNITDDQLDIVFDMYFEHFVDFLSESFEWHETPEGYEYWLEVSRYNFMHS